MLLSVIFNLFKTGTIILFLVLFCYTDIYN